MDHESGWARIGPPLLERLGYIIERNHAKPKRTGQARHLPAVTAALSLAALMSAIAHSLLIEVTVAAVAALVALLAAAGRRQVVPRRRRGHLMPAPDPQLTQRTHTTVTSVPIERIRPPAARVSLPGTPTTPASPRR